jgi:hypothetical protein
MILLWLEISADGEFVPNAEEEGYFTRATEVEAREVGDIGFAWCFLGERSWIGFNMFEDEKLRTMYDTALAAVKGEQPA